MGSNPTVSAIKNTVVLLELRCFLLNINSRGVIRKIRVYDIYKWLIKVANYFHAILVECEENSKYQYKLVIYDNTFDDNPLEKVYAIGNIDYNKTDGKKIANFIIKLEENNYDSKKVFRQLLRDYTKQFKLILGQYNIKSKRFNDIGRNSVKNGRVNEGHSNGTGTNQEIGQELSAGVKEMKTQILT